MPKFIGVDETVLRILQIGASDPISLTLEVANQMVTDKSPSSRDEYLAAICHWEYLICSFS